MPTPTTLSSRLKAIADELHNAAALADAGEQRWHEQCAAALTFKQRFEELAARVEADGVESVARQSAGSSSLVACAEASAAWLVGNDRQQAAYLRRRGWVQVANGWRAKDAGPGDFLPVGMAVRQQVLADVSPFTFLMAEGPPPGAPAAAFPHAA